MGVHSATKADRSELDRGDKRARILDSALRVFADKGFFGAKVSDIAAAAGVADGTIYLYFKSKDDVLISLFEGQMQQVIGSLKTAISDAASPTDKLRCFIDSYVDQVQQHPHATEVLTIELRQSAKFMKEYANPRFAEFLKLLASVIQSGQDAGEFDRELPAPVAARAIFGMLDELALMWVTGQRGKKIDIEHVGRWVFALLSRGLCV